MALQGRKSWSYATWARYVGAGKSPAEVRRRLELARVEAPAGALDRLIARAEETLAKLEERAAVDAGLSDRAGGLASDAGKGKSSASGDRPAWWW